MENLTFRDEATKRAFEFNKKYNFGHVASALSFRPIVDYIYSIENEHKSILLGKPFGASVLYQKWLELNYITEEDLDNLLGVYRPSDQDKLNIPRIDYVAPTLGNALGVAVGLAWSNKKQNYTVIISDSSLLMGPTLEAIILMKDLDIKNLEVVVDWNDWTSKSQMPIDIKSIQDYLYGLDILQYFKFFNNPKGYGVIEIEKEPDKWHY